jgi:hypothetical protein
MSAEAKKYAGFRAKYINSLSKDRMGTATKSTAARAKGIANREDKKAAAKKASYSPAPMSAIDKRAAGFRGANTQFEINLRKRDAAAAKAKLKKELKPIKSESRSKAGSSTAASIAKRFGVTAREARDIYTAVGSAAQALRKSPQEGIPVKKTIKNIGTQVKETARAAATGKKGTTAYKLKPDPYSKAKRKAAGGKGFVFYDVTKPKKR